VARVPSWGRQALQLPQRHQQSPREGLRRPCPQRDRPAFPPAVHGRPAHDLRHTYASLLINNGGDVKYISEQMGRASVQITLARYGHLFPNAKREAVLRLERNLFPSQGGALGEPGVADAGQTGRNPGGPVGTGGRRRRRRWAVVSEPAPLHAEGLFQLAGLRVGVLRQFARRPQALPPGPTEPDPVHATYAVSPFGELATGHPGRTRCR
jgi:Phage integrase family